MDLVDFIEEALQISRLIALAATGVEEERMARFGQGNAEGGADARLPRVAHYPDAGMLFRPLGRAHDGGVVCEQNFVIVPKAGEVRGPSLERIRDLGVVRVRQQHHAERLRSYRR
jgi:hypothetical protein